MSFRRCLRRELGTVDAWRIRLHRPSKCGKGREIPGNTVPPSPGGRMKAFLLTVTRERGVPLTLTIIAHSSFDVHTSALDMFGVCKISVRPA